MNIIEREIRHDVTRADVINKLVQKIGATSYLEIGVQTGKTFRAVQVPYKVGVDPDPYSKATIYTTSDRFFELNTQTYDIIFVDGLHHWEACYKDIQNSLKFLNKGGIIVVDDIAPRKQVHQEREPADLYWTGDVWKTWFKVVDDLRQNKKMYTVNVALGIGIIEDGETSDFIPTYFNDMSRDWNMYEKTNEYYHKMITWEEFEKNQ